jgi:hypothetical protein
MELEWLYNGCTVHLNVLKDTPMLRKLGNYGQDIISKDVASWWHNT